MIHRLDLAGGRTGIDSDAGRAADLDRCPVRGRGARPHLPARPPAAAALHLHGDGGRSRPAPAAAAARHRHDHQRLADLDPAGGRSASSPARSRRSLLIIFFAGYLVSGPRRPLAGRQAGPRHRPSRAAATSARSSSPGWPASASSSSRRTSAPRCCSSASSSRCSTSPPSAGRWIAIGLVLFAAGAYLAYRIFGHVQQRVELWLDPFCPGTRRAATSWSRA